MAYTSWMTNAIYKIGSLPAGTEFFLKDLFDGVEWQKMPKGDRLSFGKDFKKEVLGGLVPNTSYIGKADNNSAKYIKL